MQPRLEGQRGDALLLCVQKEFVDGALPDVGHVFRVVSEVLRHLERLEQPVLFQASRLRIVIEFLQHLADHR